MDASAVRTLICEIFLNGDTDAPIGFETRLLDSGICDSLGLVQLAVELEKRCLGLQIDDQDVTWENFGSITAIVKFLRSKNGG